MKRCWIGLLLLFAASVACAAEEAKESQAPAAVILARLRHRCPCGYPSYHQRRCRDASYTATAGYIPIADESGKLLARIFYVAYTKEPRGDAAARPLTFAFNGGPGASSMWLHLGLGPKRAAFNSDGTVLDAAARLLDNESTWLQFTDLVFVDPIGTGFSRAAEGVDAKQYYEVSRDVQIAAGFIRRYITQSDRWLSPRSSRPKLWHHPSRRRRQRPAGGLRHQSEGVILISCALNYETFWFEEGNDLPYVLSLPSYTASAWYHNKLSAPLQADLAGALKQAQEWAMNDYVRGLMKGERLTDAERDELADRLARYTGLGKDYLLRRHLRVDVSSSRWSCCATPAARSDAWTAVSPRSYRAKAPIVLVRSFAVRGNRSMAAALNAYLRNELNFRTDLRYEYLSNEVNRAWRWLSGGQGNLYVVDDLEEAMSRDNRLGVFVGAGYYDLATPYLAQLYTFDHMQLDPALRRNVTINTYATGHQIYTHADSRAKLAADVGDFVRLLSQKRRHREHGEKLNF